MFLISKLFMIHTSSGNQTPGCVLPSRIATANAAVAVPTDLKGMKPIVMISKL